MENLIKVDFTPINKLIDVLTKAVGTCCEPWQIVRKAKAEAKAESIKAIEQAKTKAIIDGDLDKAQYLDRINDRLVNKESKRQKNIEDVINVASNVLETEKSVSEEPVNPDWATRFFDIVQDISDEKMQKLWAQILAGEIKHPKSYSLRTLEVLRNMTKEEAEIFQKVAQFVLLQIKDKEAFIYSDKFVLKEFDVTYSDIIKLVEIGLLQSDDSTTTNIYSDNKSDKKIELVYGDVLIIIFQKRNAENISFPVRLLTTAGRELINLISLTSNIDYIKYLATRIKSNNVKVSYSKIISIDETGMIIHDTNNIIEL
ncbi:MAG: DUF2806 domain-containing protein [Bacteroidales bacterium]|nr:DUF2806 domain-containing protein [Bacteroidales bacterium]